MRWKVIAAAVALVLAGCSNDEDSSGISSTPTSVREPVAFPDEISTNQVSIAIEFGYFQVASEDGTLHLQLRWTGGYPAEPASQMTERDFELPAERWKVTLRAGRNLVPTCSDIVDPSAPQRQVDHEIPVVGGRVVLVELPDKIEGPATAELTELVIQLPDGTIESIGSLTISTNRLGFFPG